MAFPYQSRITCTYADPFAGRPDLVQQIQQAIDGWQAAGLTDGIKHEEMRPDPAPGSMPFFVVRYWLTEQAAQDYLDLGINLTLENMLATFDIYTIQYVGGE